MHFPESPWNPRELNAAPSYIIERIEERMFELLNSHALEKITVLRVENPSVLALTHAFAIEDRAHAHHIVRTTLRAGQYPPVTWYIDTPLCTYAESTPKRIPLALVDAFLSVHNDIKRRMKFVIDDPLAPNTIAAHHEGALQHVSEIHAQIDLMQTSMTAAVTAGTVWNEWMTHPTQKLFGKIVDLQFSTNIL